MVEGLGISESQTGLKIIPVCNPEIQHPGQLKRSGESKRIIGRPKINSLIHGSMN